ncbi:phosphotransferase [Yinghuangia sp. YIM S09857]|uniref:phosphotransferase n=1 Tax=Yinghuangia sp. YIM S09857 TaxID=3436929 RepID=UPI003F53309B
MARRGLPLDGLHLHQAGRSMAFVAMTSVGPVVVQIPGEHYRSSGPVLAPQEILTTPDALRVVNAQRPGLTAPLLYAQDERLIVTGYVGGVHAADSFRGTNVDHVVRSHLLEELPAALAQLLTIEVPEEARRHNRVDSVASMLDRAAEVRAVRYPAGGPRLAEFGLTERVFSELRDTAVQFVERPRGVLHNDIHYANVLVQYDVRRNFERIRLLDLQGLSEGDPVLDVATAGVKLGGSPEEMARFTERWQVEAGPARTAGAERDLPAAMAAFGAAQASVAVPAADQQIRTAAQRDRSSVDQVIQSNATFVTNLLGPVQAFLGRSPLSQEQVERRLEKAVPRNRSATASRGFHSVKDVQPLKEHESAAIRETASASTPAYVVAAKRAIEKSLYPR